MANVSTAANCGIFEPPAKPKITKEMKAAVAGSGLSKAEQKASLNQQLEQAKEKYAADLALWKAKPETSQEKVDALKSIWEQKKINYKENKLNIKNTYKEEVEKAKKLEDMAAQKLAISVAKNKQHNAILDLNEDLRVAKAAYDASVLSSDELYRNHQRTKLWAAVWRDKYLYVMLIPYLVFFIVFSYLPMYGILIGFKDYSPLKGVWDSPWAPMNGFYYFYTFFTGPYFLKLLRNTFLINIYALIFSFPVPIIFALMLNEVRVKLFKTTIQTISYLPNFVSTVVVAGLVVNFLSPSTGIINFAYKWITGADSGIYFLAKPEYFRAIYTIMGIWCGAGFNSILYTSALAGIDQELYEAARIDGASRWRQLFNITIPGIMPTIAIMLIMQLGNILAVGYETIILLYQPVTYETADVISTYLYRVGLVEGNYELSTAVGLCQSVVSVIMVNLSNIISRKVGEVGLW